MGNWRKYLYGAVAFVLVLGMLGSLAVVYSPIESKEGKRFEKGQVVLGKHTVKGYSNDGSRRLQGDGPQMSELQVTTVVTDVFEDSVELMVMVGNFSMDLEDGPFDSGASRRLRDLADEYNMTLPFCLISGNVTEGALTNLECPPSIDSAIKNTLTYSAEALLTTTEETRFVNANYRTYGREFNSVQGPCRFYERRGSTYYCPKYERVVGEKTVTYRTTIDSNSVFRTAARSTDTEDEPNEYEESNQLNMATYREATFDKETGQALSIADSGSFSVPTFSASDETTTTNFTDSFNIERSIEYQNSFIDSTLHELDSFVDSLRQDFELESSVPTDISIEGQDSGERRRLTETNLLNYTYKAFEVLNFEGGIKLYANLNNETDSINVLVTFYIKPLLEVLLAERKLGELAVKATKKVLKWKSGLKESIKNITETAKSKFTKNNQEAKLDFEKRAQKKKDAVTKVKAINEKMKSDMAAQVAKANDGNTTDPTILNKIYSEAIASYIQIMNEIDSLEKGLQTKLNSMADDLNNMRTITQKLAETNPDFSRYNSDGVNITDGGEPVLSFSSVQPVLDIIPIMTKAFMSNLNRSDINWDVTEMDEIDKAINISDWATALNNSYYSMLKIQKDLNSTVFPEPVRLDVVKRDLDGLKSFVKSSGQSLAKSLIKKENSIDYGAFSAAIKEKLKQLAINFLNNLYFKRETLYSKEWVARTPPIFITTPIGAIVLSINVNFRASAEYELLIGLEETTNTLIPRASITATASAGLNLVLGEIGAAAAIGLVLALPIVIGLKLLESKAYYTANITLDANGKAGVYYKIIELVFERKCARIKCGRRWATFCIWVPIIRLSDPRWIYSRNFYLANINKSLASSIIKF